MEEKRAELLSCSSTTNYAVSATLLTSYITNYVSLYFNTQRTENYSTDPCHRLEDGMMVRPRRCPGPAHGKQSM